MDETDEKRKLKEKIFELKERIESHELYIREQTRIWDYEKDELKRKLTVAEEEKGVQEEILKSLSRPPLMKTIILKVLKDTAEVSLNNSIYEVAFNPRLKKQLKRGKIASLNPQNYAIVDVHDSEKEGLTAVVNEVLDNGKLKINLHGNPSIVQGYKGVNRGDVVVLDHSESIILENLGKKNKGYTLETITEFPWTKIGGLGHVIETITDAIETPFLHKELYEKYHKRIPKGVLLYGPPGCGKTLLGRATAFNLAKALEKRTGSATTSHFLNIKGPEILNKYVGTSEETIRQIFASAKETADETKEPVIIFVDEAESILKRRGTGISTDIYDSIVPQFLAELDGVISNENIILFLATNREDLIDPAIIRPGRIDIKLNVPRPDKEGTYEIYKIYLEGLPFSRRLLRQTKKEQCTPVDYLALSACNKIFSNDKLLGVIEFFDETQRPIVYNDLISGAVIEHSVQKATDYALKREIESKKNSNSDYGLHLPDLLNAIDFEFNNFGMDIGRILTKSDVQRIAGEKYDQIRNIRGFINSVGGEK